MSFRLKALLLLPAFLALMACSRSTPTPAAASPAPSSTATPAPSPSPQPTATFLPTEPPTASPTQPPTASPTQPPTGTPIPTVTFTPTVAASPTPEFPPIQVLEQANCRYGPGKAYLYSHGLYAGDLGQAHGRNYSGTWLWILPETLDRRCWVAASEVELNGEAKSLPVVQTRLPQSVLYGPPPGVEAFREGDTVIISWDRVDMTEDDDRGYLIEADVCQGGAFFPLAVHTDEPSLEITDEPGCSGESGGRLYTVEKHGYTEPVEIPWP